MARHWVKFNVFFETMEDEDEDDLFDQVVDAVALILDPACSELDWDSLGGVAPEGHTCTRTWTASSCSVPALPDDSPEIEVDELLDAIEAALCDSCGRPVPGIGGLTSEHQAHRIFLRKSS